MRFSQIILIITLTCLVSCFYKKKISNEGVVAIEFKIYDSAATPTFFRSSRIWYKNNLAIEEIKLTQIDTDTSGKESVNEILEHYIFINRTSKSFYIYKTFSDTAKIIKKYTQSDSADIDGGTNFYFKKKIDYNNIPQRIDDTVIDGVKYKREVFNRGKDKRKYFSIGFFRCDKKNSIFSIYQYLKEECPMVKIQNFRLNSVVPLNSLEIKFLSDSLTEFENKIFEIWEKNSQKNPINQMIR